MGQQFPHDLAPILLDGIPDRPSHSQAPLVGLLLALHGGGEGVLIQLHPGDVGQAGWIGFHDPPLVGHVQSGLDSRGPVDEPRQAQHRGGAQSDECPFVFGHGSLQVNLSCSCLNMGRKLLSSERYPLLSLRSL